MTRPPFHSPVRPGAIPDDDPSRQRTSREDASRAIRALGRAPAPAPSKRYVGATSEGARVVYHSNLPPEQAREKLAEHIIQVERTGVARRTDRRVNETERRLAALVSQAPVAMPPPPASALPPGADALAPLLAMVMQLQGHAQHWPGSPLAAVGGRPGPLLADSVDRYLRWMAQKHERRARSASVRLPLMILLESVGNKSTTDLEVADADTFLEAIQHWPANATKRQAFRHMSAPQVVEKVRRTGEPVIKRRTQQIYIDQVRSYFVWLERRHEITPGLLRGIKFWSAKNDPGGHRHPFSDEDLRTIFATRHVPTFTRPDMYWVPLIALYQGMRLTEICQLYVDDVILRDGVPRIAVTAERRGQRLKTHNARRVLAIHPILLDLGLAAFIEQACRWKRDTLFPGLIWGENGPGDGTSAWFNATFLRKRCKIEDRKCTFHSFRHNFANVAELSDVPWPRIAKLLGHQAGQNTLQAFYFQARPMEFAQEDVRSLRFPALDHVPYDPTQFEDAFRQADERAARAARLDRIYGPRR